MRGQAAISLWGLKETEIKENVITRLDTGSDKARAHLLLADTSLKCPAGQRDIREPVWAPAGQLHRV